MPGRNASEADRNLAHARLSGLGAWNGQGLNPFLAETSSGDSNREWMEPLADLLRRVKNDFDAGETVSLSAAEATQLDDLAAYQAAFDEALA